MRIYISAICIFIVLLSFSIFSQVPNIISYQGILTDDTGTPINGDQILTFTLYDAETNGTMLWQEIQVLPVIDGSFHVNLGDVTTLDLDFDIPYWLSVKVGSGSELSPRIQLTSSAYSFMANTVEDSSITTNKIVDGAVTQSKLAAGLSLPPGGSAGGDLTGTYPDPIVTGIQNNPVSALPPVAGQVLKWSGSVWAPNTDDAGTSLWNQNGNNIYYNAGRVGIGTNNPFYPLHIAEDTVSINGLEIANLGSSNLGLDGDVVPYGGSALAFDLGNNTTTEHWDDIVGLDFVTFSDISLKNNISNLSHGLNAVLELRPVSYRYNKSIDVSEKMRYGLVAQEVEKIIPDVVIDEDFDYNPDTGQIEKIKSEYKTMNYLELIPVLIKAIQEQQEQIEKLKVQVNELSRR